jgi:Bacteriophage lambda head decoration protein D
MATLNELARTTECLTWRVDRDYCSLEGVLAVGNSVLSNTIVKAPLTAMVPAVATDTTGLYIVTRDCNATAAATKISLLDRGPAVINSNFLVYPAGATAPQRAAINAYFLTQDIKVKV